VIVGFGNCDNPVDSNYMGALKGTWNGNKRKDAVMV
jgi:hypothetical protein